MIHCVEQGIRSIYTSIRSLLHDEVAALQIHKYALLRNKMAAELPSNKKITQR